MNWQPIDTAPKNPAGESTGPWILIWYKYDHQIIHARWSYNGSDKGWTSKSGDDTKILDHYVTHWTSEISPPQDKEKDL